MRIIRRRTDYALRCLVILSQTSNGKVVSVHKLAEQEDIPEDLLHKVMQALTRAELVRPIRGRTGGFGLAKPAKEITVLKVLEVLQRPFAVSRCFLSDDHCVHQEDISLCNKFEAIQDELLNFFDKVTIADLAHQAETVPSPA